MIRHKNIILLVPLLSVCFFNCEREITSSGDYNGTESLSLLNPRGGERYTVNQIINVQWSSSNISDNLRIELVNDNESVYSRNNIPNTGVYILRLPADVIPSKKYQLKILSMNNPRIFDISEPYFEIAPLIDGRWYYSNMTEFSGLELDLNLLTFINDSFIGRGIFHLKYLSSGNLVNYEKTDTVAGVFSYPDISFVMREPGYKEFYFTGAIVTIGEIKGRITGFVDSTYGTLNDSLTLVRQ